jgi:hypothetical protein
VQILAVVFLGICAGLAVFRAVDAYQWREMRRFRLYALLSIPLIVGAGFATWQFFASPDPYRGVGAELDSDWVCSGSAALGDLVCIKKSAPASTQPENAD